MDYLDETPGTRNVTYRFSSIKGQKAKKVAASLKKGSGRKATRIHTKVHFFKPNTLKLARNPKVLPASIKTGDTSKAYDIIKFPLTTDSAMKKIEDNNTLVFIVSLTANKRQIKDAVKKLYDVQALKVNTLIRYPKPPTPLYDLLYYFLDEIIVTNATNINFTDPMGRRKPSSVLQPTVTRSTSPTE